MIQLVYTSRNAIAVSGVRALVHFNDIVATARSNNQRLGVCGFLLFDRRCFYQVLEGPAEQVEALYSRILQDRRHTDVTLLARMSIATPRFAGWSMASFLGEESGELTSQAHGLPALSGAPISAEQFLRFAGSYLSVENAEAGKPTRRGSDDHT